MKINSKLRALVRQHKVLPTDSECLCVKYADKRERKAPESCKLVCPRCGGSGFINKRRETLRASYESYVLGRRLAYLSVAMIVLLFALSLIND